VPEHALTAARQLLATGERVVLGIVGPPGAGKSTLSEGLQAMLGVASIVVPMDGFHLAQIELERLGRAARKGAPDTFDVFGYAALLARLRMPRTAEWIYAPFFDRAIEEPIAGAIRVPPEVRLIITEGNYLLHDQEPWSCVRPFLDACWYVEVPEAERHRRLVARHMKFGRGAEDARAWVDRNDMPNARLIEQGRERADLVIAWEG